MNLIKHSERKFDLITVGRTCIDLNAVEYKRAMEKKMTLSNNVGGSPATIAIGTAKLGLNVGFSVKLSADPPGRFLANYLLSLIPIRRFRRSVTFKFLSYDFHI
ncbi:PfkB family carbohydrate kinase, partial [Listeria monocytogenes]|uniref:PfkB family carbohydrate kinase n=1 Tax=Listeria monocytogenes TaxID=1639 RepID=UPI000A544A8A